MSESKGRGLLLNVGRRGGDNGAVRLANANVVDLGVLRRGSEADAEHAQVTDAGLGLHADDAENLAGSGAVGVVGVGALELFEVAWLAGIKVL
jgi:hypothetical protein